MKKALLLFIAVITVCFFVGCGKADDLQDDNNRESEKTQETSEDPKTSDAKTEQIFDVDLTKLSSTMVYSEVYNMMNSPDGYIGKSVRMKGTFSVYRDEATGKNYYACLIADATACCSQGIEFVLKDERKYPDEYPELGNDITVSGIFHTYNEGEYMYCELTDAVLE